MHAFIAIFLPVYFLLFVGFAFLWRSWRTYRITGINPYRLPDNPGAEQVTSRYFRLLPFMSLTVLLFLLPGAYSYLAPITWLEHPYLQWLGIVLMTASLVIIVVAQGQMGESWRIGVDYENHTEFVERGLFRYSRNPIFLGIMLSVAGLFFLLPNALTLLIMMLDLALIQVQIRIEEEHLSRLHGDVYRGYCERVGRWL